VDHHHAIALSFQHHVQLLASLDALKENTDRRKKSFSTSRKK
jgi:hypothetical protein